MNDDYAYWEMSEELNAVSRKSTTEVTVCIEWEMLQKKNQTSAYLIAQLEHKN